MQFRFQTLVIAALALASIASQTAIATPTGALKGKTYVLDGRALPLGDGKISTQPQRGYVYACPSRGGGGGAQAVGNWINGMTWDETRKIFVQGQVEWPQAEFAITVTGSDAGAQRTLTGNGLPVNHATGTYPVARSDPAYSIDRNPNSIAARSATVSVPKNPTFAATSTCVNMGKIGVMLNGVGFFNAMDAENRDAVAHEVQDRCNGHPERSGQYHYHGSSPCLKGANDNNALVGYALDGFGIFSMFDANGKELTNADLDECHGRISRVLWDGKEVEMYHYVLTREFPYTVGCYRGTPVQSAMDRPGPGGGGGGGGRPPPPWMR